MKCHRHHCVETRSHPQNYYYHNVVHNISQCSQRRATDNMHKKLEVGHMVFEIYELTDKQTNILITTVCIPPGGELTINIQQQHPFNGLLSRTTWMSRYQKGKTNLDLLQQETVIGSGISWAICKSAPCPRQIIKPAPHHSDFYRLDALLLPNQQRQSTEMFGN